MLPQDLLDSYQTTRASGVDRSVLCHAPFASLNFDQSGAVTACCYNRQYRLGSYPQQSLREIWAGAPARALREAFLAGAEAPGCDGCFDQLRAGNFAGALLRNFDDFGGGSHGSVSRNREVPLLLEFEIANTCSLECVMCGGHWSSAIRSRRERLPPLANPYDERFLEQIEELLPTIVGARFLGGEPFLIPAYLRIWDGLRRLNPGARISITTSGAVLPDRQRQLLEELQAHIVVSLDGITAETYESIRRNASFAAVMENVLYFRDYTRRRRTSLTLAVCPMTHNWRELPAIVDFCESHQMTLFFNTVTFPVESSLSSLDTEALAEVVATLAAAASQPSRAWSPGSRAQWRSLLSQLGGWQREQQAARALADEAAAARRLRQAGGELEFQRRWAEAQQLLATAAIEPSRRTPVARHLETLVAERFRPAASGVDADERPVQASVRDLPELRDALAAVSLFHAAFAPTESQVALHRRLERVGNLLTPAAERVEQALASADIRAIYDFLSSAPDADFERALESFAT